MPAGNVQLSEREAVKVFIDLSTGRILGMSPASIPVPLLPAGFRWKSETLLHTYEIEAYLNKWREQVKEEAMSTAVTGTASHKFSSVGSGGQTPCA